MRPTISEMRALQMNCGQDGLADLIVGPEQL